MSAIIQKPKSRTAIIVDLAVNETAIFPADEERSISAIISGSNAGSPRIKHPDRKYKTNKVPYTDPDTRKQIEVLQVTRTA